MKKNIIIGLGAFVLLLGVLSNLQWAATDYGYKTASLHPQIMAKNTDSGTNPVKPEDEPAFKMVSRNCVANVQGEANGTAKFGPFNIQLNAMGEGKVVLQMAEKTCEKGGNSKCNPLYCWEIFMFYGTFN